MRTTDALRIGMALGRIGATLDAWEESKHPRQPDGKFGSGGSSNASSSKSTTGSKSQIEKLESKADALEKEYYEEMSSTESKHSKGWRDERKKKIAELRAEIKKLKYGK
jgi:archaellum component FlaC